MTENLQINKDNKSNAVEKMTPKVMDSDAWAKIQNDLIVVNICLQNLIQMRKMTNEALIEGKIAKIDFDVNFKFD